MNSDGRKSIKIENFADSDGQFDTCAKYCAYHALPRIATKRIQYMTMEETLQRLSRLTMQCMASITASTCPMIMSCELSQHFLSQSSLLSLSLCLVNARGPTNLSFVCRTHFNAK